MIQPIKDKRRRKAEKQALHGMPAPQPEWVEAFMILLLYTKSLLEQQITGEPASPEITVTIEQLEAFKEMKNNKTLMTFDSINQSVTITAPEIKLPEIIIPKPKLII